MEGPDRDRDRVLDRRRDAEEQTQGPDGRARLEREKPVDVGTGPEKKVDRVFRQGPLAAQTKYRCMWYPLYP